jgi:hypothetical protein
MSELRSKELPGHDRFDSNSNKLLNTSKIFPFCSVFNLLLLAQMKAKQKSKLRKKLDKRLKHKKQEYDKNGSELANEPTKSSERNL